MGKLSTHNMQMTILALRDENDALFEQNRVLREWARQVSEREDVPAGIRIAAVKLSKER